MYTSLCVSSEKEKNARFYPARSLELKTMPLLFFKLFSAQSLFKNHFALFYQNTSAKTQNDCCTWEVSDLTGQQAEHWFENTCWFSLEEQGGRKHRKTKVPPSSMCVKHTSIFPECSAFTELHPWGRKRFKKVKDHLRTAHAHHTNTANKREISGQIMNKTANADGYFKLPGGKKGGRERKKTSKICPFPGAE